MSKQQLLAYPYVEELEYRSKIDPYKLNLMLRSIEESVLRSILRGSESQETLNDLKLGVETSYNALQSQAAALFGYADILSGTTLFATSFDVVISGHQNRVAGITTLDWHSNRAYTKIPRYDTDNDGVADQVAPSVQILVDGVPRTTENKAYNALNRSNKSFWIEEVSNGPHLVEIQLPPSINKNFNYLEIVPFPMFGVQISGVTYQDSLSTEHILYSKDSDSYKFYNNSGPLVMHVAPKETNGTFKIYVDVTHGAIGFSSIDFAMIDYKDEEQTIYMKIMNFPTDITTCSLDKLNIDFYVDNEGTNVLTDFFTEISITNGITDAAKVTVENLSQFNSDSGYDFKGSALDTSTTEMYLKLVIKEHNTTTPVIRGCKLTYFNS